MLKIAIGMVHLTILSFVLFVSRISTLNPLQMIKDPELAKIHPFDVYWNVPTFMCRKHGVDFEASLKNFKIQTNNGDKFRGEKITLLYDPGLFPMYLKDQATGNLTEVNGGIPPRGNLEDHLTEFTTVVVQQTPVDYAGLAIIDFESWRPIFRQHWNDQLIYKNMTVKYVKEKYPSLSEKEAEAKAKELFEASARKFMESTLKKAADLRPNAKWGYYGFPYCLNYGKNNSADCPQMVKQENDQIYWLFQNSRGLYPSVYSSKNLTKDDHKYFVTARMNEASRMVTRVSKKHPPGVFPYVWYRHHDGDDFIKEEVMQAILETIKGFQLGGVIIWGSSHELKTKEECDGLYKYLGKTLGPMILKLQQS